MREAPNYQIAYFGAGDWHMNATTAKLKLATQLGAWSKVSAACALHKDPAKVSITQSVWQEIATRGQAASSSRPPKGLGFTPVVQSLSGPGAEMAKSPDLAFFLLPEYQADIEVAAERFASAVESKGGVPIMWGHGSTGGHVVAEQVLGLELRKRMGRPETVVMELLQPGGDDEASSWIFRERMRHLFETGWQGIDLTFLVRNNLGLQLFPSLREFDDVAAVSLTLWLAAQGPNQVNLAELLAALKQAGPMAGIWGTKVPVAKEVLNRPTWTGIISKGRRDDQHQGLLRHQCLEALNRVRDEPTTSLSGLPALPNSQSFYGLILPLVSPSLVTDIRKAWEGEGPITIVSSPYLTCVYAVRIASVDPAPLALELNVAVGDGVLRNGWHRRKFESIGEVFSAVEQKRRMSPGAMSSIWGK